MAAPSRIVPREEILSAAADPPPLRLPDPGMLFTARGARLQAIAASGHPDGDYLQLVAAIAQAQQAALDVHPEPQPLEQRHIELCRAHGLPLLGKDGTRDRAWRAALDTILRQVDTTAPAPVRAIVARLAGQDDASREAKADALLGFDYPALDPAEVPFLAAALQVHWVRRAAALGVDAFAGLDIRNICPVCGSPPLASVLSLAPVPGIRYLQCALCAAEWRVPRGQCTQCGVRERVAYFHIETGSEAVKAEACEACRAYLKIFNPEQDAAVEATADDLGTLALDLLMDESGYERSGPNFFFVPGHA